MMVEPLIFIHKIVCILGIFNNVENYEIIHSHSPIKHTTTDFLVNITCKLDASSNYHQGHQHVTLS